MALRRVLPEGRRGPFETEAATMARRERFHRFVRLIERLRMKKSSARTQEGSRIEGDDTS